MRPIVRALLALAGCLLLMRAAVLAAVAPALKCEAAKLKAAGKDAACQANALAKAALGGVNTVSQCDAKLTAVFTKLEANGGCATKNDAPTTAARIDLSSIIVRASFFYPGVPGVPTNGFNFTDNGDGTVTDNNTGLQWEQKTFDQTSVHYYRNFYTWSSTGCVNSPVNGVLLANNGDNGTAPDGTAYTTLLATLNNAAAPGGCFAGHCDWRLPTAAEVGTIDDPLVPVCPCIDPVFGPADLVYWSSTTDSLVANKAVLNITWAGGISFSDDKCANAGLPSPFFGYSARAVRGPICGVVGLPCCAGSTCTASAGSVCLSGSCTCPTGQTDCAGTCVNTQNDPNNCGACGFMCRTSVGFVCTAGACQCPAGETRCGTNCNVSALCYCANLQNDNNNCGSCGHVCTTLPVCIGGVCTIP